MVDAGAAGRMLDIPPELRVLVQFLNTDRRPTVVLVPPDISPDHPDSIPVDVEIIYRNPAFDRLPETTKLLKDMQYNVVWTVRSQGDCAALHDRMLKEISWHSRIVEGYCVVVPADGGQQLGGEDVAAALEEQDLTYPSVDATAGPSIRKPIVKKAISPQDWTRSPSTEFDASVTPWTRFMRDFNWTRSAVGPIESWDSLLRQCVLFMTGNPNPRLLIWGESLTMIYNEACVQQFGEKHPSAMGRPVEEHWGEIWSWLKPTLDAVFRGETVQLSDQLLTIQRNGFTEDTYWDSILLPVFNVEGRVVGIFDELTETTVRVTGERRRPSMQALSERLAATSTLPELWSAVLEAVKHDLSTEIPFAMFYTVVDEIVGSEETESTSTDTSSRAHRQYAKLVGTAGIPVDHPHVVDSFSLSGSSVFSTGVVQKYVKAWQSRRPITITTTDGSLPVPLSSAASGDPLRTAIISPIKATSSLDVIGILITGLNPRYSFNAEYELFMHLTTELIEKAAALISLPEEQRRAKEISDEINSALAQQLRLTTLQAERSEAKFSRLAATAPTGMFMFDADGKALYVNDTYIEMMGQMSQDRGARKPEVLRWHDQVHAGDLDRFILTWTRIKDEKVPITIEYRLKRPWRSTDNSTGQELEGEFWLLATAFPEIEANGTVTAIQGWLTDISHRKFSENLVAQRLEDALENKRQTENFIDMTSHEMRNPLSAILQSADSIVSTLASVKGTVQPEQRAILAPPVEDILDAAQTIILCAQHQKRIVDDILTLSKLDASLLVISPDKVQAPSLITKALKMYEGEIERAGIDVQMCIEPSYEELSVDYVVLDPSRLLQVIINILGNAVKFTAYSDVRKIKVCLGASRQQPTGRHHGISFAPLRHNNRPTRPTFPEESCGEDVYLQIAVYDTGRGLTPNELGVLFQRFQQGNPKTYSQYGGSGLGLFISRELCELQGGQIGAASIPGKTVFAFYVRATRWIAESVETLPTRLRKFTSAAVSPVSFSRRGSVQLHDTNNPMQNQYIKNGSIVEEFKPNSRKRSLTPTPTTATQITKVARQLSSAVTRTREGLHVLIVEDNIINQKVMSQQLRRAGCTIHLANHGVECLDFLDRSSFSSAPTPLHLILLDLEMPTMDGLTCIRHIREREHTGKLIGHVPVIAVTANARSEQIAMAIEAGMDRVVTKPFRIPELVPQMEALVEEFALQAAGKSDAR